MAKAIKGGFIGACLVLLAACASLDSQPIFSDDDGALRGYDAVAYFTEDAAVKGLPEHQSNYRGAVFSFASAGNKTMFDANPEAYLPAYGGYCAYGMSRNYVVSSDPEAFTVVDNTLYLNYSQGVRKTWTKDIPGNIARANDNWRAKLASDEPVEE